MAVSALPLVNPRTASPDSGSREFLYGGPSSLISAHSSVACTHLNLFSVFEYQNVRKRQGSRSWSHDQPPGPHATVAQDPAPTLPDLAAMGNVRIDVAKYPKAQIAFPSWVDALGIGSFG